VIFAPKDVKITINYFYYMMFDDMSITVRHEKRAVFVCFDALDMKKEVKKKKCKRWL